MRMTTDKLTDHEDWKDGMNAFRLKVWQELTKLEEEVNKIKDKTKGEPQ